MKDSALEKMSVEELRELAKRIQVHIVERQQQERTNLKERLQREAQAAGYQIGDLFSVGRRGAKATKGRAGASANGVMFRHPDDPSLTWAGRGRKPKWLSEAGGNIERFRVRD